MKKTILKDLPSVHKVLLEINGSNLHHEDYIKFIINKELAKLRTEIKAGKLIKTNPNY